MDKKILSFTLTCLFFGSFAKTECAITFKKVAVISSAVVAGLAIYRLYSKKAEQIPLSRFETTKLKAAVTNKEFKEITNQIWYFIDDRLIGQMYKKDGVKANKEGNLEVSKGTPSAGLLGTLQGKIFPIATALFFAIEVKEFIEKLHKSTEIISDFIAD